MSQGVGGAAGQEYAEQLQNVHAAWLTGVNPYNTSEDRFADPQKDWFGRTFARIFGESGEVGWEEVYGDFPNVADVIKARIAKGDVHDPILTPGITRYNGIIESEIADGGSGWGLPDTFRVVNPTGGIYATGVVTGVNSGAILNYYLSDVGSGYEVAEDVVIQRLDGSGIGATLNILKVGNVGEQKNPHFKETSPGSGEYEIDPALFFDANEAMQNPLPGSMLSNITGRKTLYGDVLEELTKLVRGGAYNGIKTIAVAAFQGGTGYAVNDTFTVDGGSILAHGYVSSAPGGVVATIELTYAGAGYRVQNNTTTTNTSGTGVGMKVYVSEVFSSPSGGLDSKFNSINSVDKYYKPPSGDGYVMSKTSQAAAVQDVTFPADNIVPAASEYDDVNVTFPIEAALSETPATATEDFPATNTLPATSEKTVTTDFPADTVVPATSEKTVTTDFPATTVLGDTEVTTVPAALSSFSPASDIEGYMSSKDTRSKSDMAADFARLTAGLADIRCVMNGQFIGAMAMLETARRQRLDDMETELTERAIQTKLNHAATLSSEQRQYQSEKDRFNINKAGWLLNRGASKAQADISDAGRHDGYIQNRGAWLLNRAGSKAQADISDAGRHDGYAHNYGAWLVNRANGKAAFSMNDASRKDGYAQNRAGWLTQRASAEGGHEVNKAGGVDAFNLNRAGWQTHNTASKGTFKLNQAAAEDSYYLNVGSYFVQAATSEAQRTIMVGNALLDMYLKISEAERAAFMQEYDLFRVYMAAELDGTAHNLEVVRRAYTWEMEMFKYPMNFIASLHGAALAERAPGLGERLVASLGNAVSQGFTVGGMTGNPLMGAGWGLLNLGASALTGIQ